MAKGNKSGKGGGRSGRSGSSRASKRTPIQGRTAFGGGSIQDAPF